MNIRFYLMKVPDEQSSDVQSNDFYVTACGQSTALWHSAFISHRCNLLVTGVPNIFPDQKFILISLKKDDKLESVKRFNRNKYF